MTVNRATKNWNCGGDRCGNANGEVRVLPTGGGGNAILCRQCFEHEIRFRVERNKHLPNGDKFSLPQWEELRIYEEV